MAGSCEIQTDSVGSNGVSGQIQKRRVFRKRQPQYTIPICRSGRHGTCPPKSFSENRFRVRHNEQVPSYRYADVTCTYGAQNRNNTRMKS